MAVAQAAAASSGTLGVMYYKFSGFTQNLVGAWASHAYNPQVRVAPRRPGQEKWPSEPVRQSVAAPEPGMASATGLV